MLAEIAVEIITIIMLNLRALRGCGCRLLRSAIASWGGPRRGVALMAG